MNHVRIIIVLLITVIMTIGCVENRPTHTVSIKVLNEWGRPVIGATVTAGYNLTASNGGNSGISSSTNVQTGTTDSSGTVAFSMIGSQQYDLIVTYQGEQKSFQIYPADSTYILWFKK